MQHSDVVPSSSVLFIYSLVPATVPPLGGCQLTKYCTIHTEKLVLRPLQVVTSIGELVEACSPQILSGWRPLFSALRTVHGGKADTKDYLLGEYSMGTWVLSVQVWGGGLYLLNAC